MAFWCVHHIGRMKYSLSIQHNAAALILMVYLILEAPYPRIFWVKPNFEFFQVAVFELRRVCKVNFTFIAMVRSKFDRVQVVLFNHFLFYFLHSSYS